jgi:hypothetical protein
MIIPAIALLSYSIVLTLPLCLVAFFKATELSRARELVKQRVCRSVRLYVLTSGKARRDAQVAKFGRFGAGLGKFGVFSRKRD